MLFIVRTMQKTQIHSVCRMQSFCLLMHVVHIESLGFKGLTKHRYYYRIPRVLQCFRRTACDINHGTVHHNFTGPVFTIRFRHLFFLFKDNAFEIQTTKFQIYTDSEAHPTSYPTGAESDFPGSNMGEA
jgi:hypothetical protein